MRAARSELEEIFGRHCMMPGEAQQILVETLGVFRVREREIGNPRGWLIAAIEDRCRRHVEEVDQTSDESN